MPILEVKTLSRYFGGLAALSNLNLTIEEGEIRGIIGPNGAGKTTLFNVISGVYRPTSGQILYRNGEHIDGFIKQNSKNGNRPNLPKNGNLS